MSLILEALRKSEAERRRGQVPNLHAELPPAARPARPAHSAWPWLALAVVMVVAMAWLAWGIWSPPSPAATSAEVVGPSPSPTDASAAGSPAGVDVGRNSAGAKPEEAAAPAALGPPPLAHAPPLPNPAAKPPSAERVFTPMSVQGSNTGALPVRRVDAVDAVAAVATVATALPPATPLPRQPVPVPATASAPIPAAPAAVPVPVPVPTRPPSTVATVAPLRLANLSAAERLELPPLKMSMHMWGPTPGERFAIIDGARVNEGDRLGDAVVEEITSRAVVLAWRGRRLQIPLR